MARTFQRPFPSVERQMSAFGARLRAARMRRHITTILFAKRMGISRDTLNRLEKGDATIALGTYMRALHVLGLEKDFDEVAKDGQLSRKLEEVDLVQRRISRDAQDPSGAGVRDA
jgi:transcriptional regulator with XRE-family HTH domain